MAKRSSESFSPPARAHPHPHPHPHTNSINGSHPAKRARMGDTSTNGTGLSPLDPNWRPPTPASMLAPQPPALKLNTATAIISQYVGSLRNNLAEHNAVYTCDVADGGGFVCRIELPFNSPIRGAASDGTFRSKQLAKQSAAFNAVSLLMDAGEISELLIPTPANPTVKKGKGNTVASGSRTPLSSVANTNGNGNGNGSGCVASGDRTTAVLRNVHPEEAAREEARAQLKKRHSSTGVMGEDQYDFLASPRWWSQNPPLGTTLSPVVLTLSFGGDGVQSTYWKCCRPLVILTSAPLPVISDGPFPLDISQPHLRATATLTPFASITITPNQARIAFAFTRRLFRALLNKAIEGSSAKTAYYVLPLQSTFKRDGSACSFTADDISWDEVAKAEGPVTQPFTMADEAVFASELEDAIISSPTELGRRFYVTRMRPDMNPSCPDPNSENLSYLDAALANEPWEYRNRKSDELTWPDQPLIEVETIVAPKSGGVVAALADLSRGRGKLVIPEFLEKYFIAASVYRTGTALVAALSTLDDELIATDLSASLFANRLQRPLVREAITCPASRAYPGASNYERLEILGDTVLKLVTSTAVYVNMDKSAEGAMSCDRHKVVSNRALQSSIIAAGVVPYIRGTNRRARDFVPPLWWVGSGPDPTPATQILGDKTVADVAEALIAAAYLSSNRSMQAAVDAMAVLCIDVNLRSWDDLAKMTRRRSSAAPDDKFTVLGYTFRNPDRGRIALVRKLLGQKRNLNHDAERRHQFERLEFLGDAVIDYLTLEPLWTDNSHLGPAPLTHMKHSRVANTALGAFLVCSGLHTHLTHMDAAITAKLEEYAAAITAKRVRADAAHEAGKASHEFWNSMPGHKWMGDIVEALFGAIFEDSGFDLRAVERVFTSHLYPFVERYAVPPHDHSLHPKSVLLELLATRKCHQWTIERTDAPDGPKGHVAAAVIVHGTVVGSAVEAKTALAVRNACEEALATLKEVKVCPCM